MLRIGWGKATLFATSAFLTTEQLSTTEMLVGKDVWRPLLLCPTQNRSGFNQDQVNHGFGPPQAQILASSSFFYHLWLLRRVWLYHLWNCPSESCKLLLKCTLVFSLLDKKNQTCQFPQPLLAGPIPKNICCRSQNILTTLQENPLQFPSLLLSFCWGNQKLEHLVPGAAQQAKVEGDNNP